MMTDEDDHRKDVLNGPQATIDEVFFSMIGPLRTFRYGAISMLWGRGKRNREIRDDPGAGEGDEPVSA